MIYCKGKTAISFKFFTLILFILLALFIGENCKAFAETRDYTKKERDIIMSVMKGTRISAQIIGDTALYKNKDEATEVIELLTEGNFVQILEDYSQEWYYVCEIFTGKKGWVRRKYLQIPNDAPVNTESVSIENLEGYINIMEFESKTDYFILTDIDRQQTHIFKGKKCDWKLVKTFPCSTGKNESPTIRGLFEISERGEWFFSERLGSGGKYWIRFKDAYLFHSQAMDKNKNVISENNEIGKRVSNGCVRLYPSDAEWLYKNVPDKTAVFIH